MKKALSILSIAVLVAGSTLAAQTYKQKAPAAAKVVAAPTDAEIIAVQLSSYPTMTCFVSDEPLVAEDGIIDYVHDGRLVRLCCKGCIKMLKKDSAPIFAQLDAAVIKAQAPTYPLKTCVISNEALGSMDGAVDYVHGTRLVRLCCKSCIKGFKKSPTPHMAKIDAALIEAQRPAYPLGQCMISGNDLTADSEDILYGTRLIRFCCPKCVTKFRSDPTTYLAKLDAVKTK